MRDAFKIYQNWLNGAYDADTKSELRQIADDKAEIEDRFYQELQFGTAGLRGIMGAGTNRMNIYTVGRAAYGMMAMLQSQGEAACKRGVAISYDSRNNSRLFAELTARILLASGVDVYFSSELRPVPFLSFAIRHYGCSCGVMITASHNPKVYNGFKAYGADGAQLGEAEANVAASFMDQIENIPEKIAALPAFLTLCQKENFHEMNKELDESYDQYILGLSTLKPDVGRDVKIVYTPLNGAGNKPVRRILHKLGFANVYVVPEQEQPNGDFPTTPFPNPELPETLELAIQLAKTKDANLVMATDPDSDRLGVAVKEQNGSFTILSGNEIGILLLEYLLSVRKAKNQLKPRSFAVSTVVSSRMAVKVAKSFEVAMYLTLTGFKNIASVIYEHEDESDGTFEFGYEESFGYLTGDQVRDKDGVVSAMMVAEMAAFEASRGRTLADRLNDLYSRYGRKAEKTISIYREGKTGLEKIAKVMEEMRKAPLVGLEELGVLKIKDFSTGKVLDVKNKLYSCENLPKSNVILYEFAGDDFACVRPSGTEPKIKIYFGFYAPELETCEQKLHNAEETFLQRINKLLGA